MRLSGGALAEAKDIEGVAILPRQTDMHIGVFDNHLRRHFKADIATVAAAFGIHIKRWTLRRGDRNRLMNFINNAAFAGEPCIISEEAARKSIVLTGG